MRGLLIILGLWLAIAGGARADDGSPVEAGPLYVCPVEAVTRCAPADGPVQLTAPRTVLVRTVIVSPAAAAEGRPLMVEIVAMASSEVSWNGVVIGRNGVPGVDRARETPGAFTAAIAVPSRLVRSGQNTVTALVSSHHLPLPVATPVHRFEVGVLADPAQGWLRRYLPALLVIGLLAVAGLYFAVTAVLERSRRDVGLLAAIAGLAVVQLATEVLRAFVNYPYPMHPLRLVAISGLTALTAVVLAAWASGRFAPALRLWAPLVVGAAAAAALALVPGFDIKAYIAAMSGVAALLVCSAIGWRRGATDARWGLAAGAFALLVALTWPMAFLDSGYYLVLAGTFATLLAAEAWAARQGLAARRRAEALLDDTLRRSAAPTVALKDGTRMHRVAPGDIISLKAADDYCEARLVDGRTRLVTEPLTRVDLPPQFVRVHRSWIVNADHVRMLKPRPGGGRGLGMSDGSEVPAGRAYTKALARWTVGAT